MSNNRLYIAAAGAGKTTFLVNKACELSKECGEKSIAIITYTLKNQQEIKNRFVEKLGFVPPCIKICGWFDFLLTYCRDSLEIRLKIQRIDCQCDKYFVS